jgi:hypothetical protein
MRTTSRTTRMMAARTRMRTFGIPVPDPVDAGGAGGGDAEVAAGDAPALVTGADHEEEPAATDPGDVAGTDHAGREVEPAATEGTAGDAGGDGCDGLMGDVHEGATGRRGTADAGSHASGTTGPAGGEGGVGGSHEPGAAAAGADGVPGAAAVGGRCAWHFQHASPAFFEPQLAQVHSSMDDSPRRPAGRPAVSSPGAAQGYPTPRSEGTG